MIVLKAIAEQTQAAISQHLAPVHLPSLSQATEYIPLMLIAAVVAFVALILLSILVRYAMVFAITGTGVFVLLLANYPRNVSPDIVDGVILTGFTALTVMLFIYEFILWRQARNMQAIALASRERHLQRRMANRSRRSAY